MRSPLYFLVKPLDGKKYDNETESGVITTTSVEDYKFTQRVAEVINTPIGYDGIIKVGDKVIVHHNTFRVQYNNQGVPLPSKYHIHDDLFYLEPELVYMVVKGDYKEAIYPYCFGSPIVDDVKFEGVKEVENKMKLKYPNKDLIRQGFIEGDTVYVKKDSEYQFDIFGEKLYMFKSKRVLCK